MIKIIELLTPKGEVSFSFSRTSFKSGESLALSQVTTMGASITYCLEKTKQGGLDYCTDRFELTRWYRAKALLSTKVRFRGELDHLT